MHAPIDWLLEGEPWIEYRTRLDLLGQSDRDPQVLAARSSMMADVQIKSLLLELSEWPGGVVSSHKSAGQSFHKLTFIADLGIKAHDPGMKAIIGKILSHQALEGPFQVPMNVPKHFGGSGKDEWAWALCDAPLILYALVNFGCSGEPAVQTAASHLAALIQDNGWPCAVSKELGKFRGPGRKNDPCPFANLVMLKALSVMPEQRESPACHTGVETLLALWSDSAVRHPYLFYMGNDFRKLKAPLIWYDLIHVLDVLSRFPWVKEDVRFLDMLGVLKSKADAKGGYTPESIWTAWKDWEFGQKKIPSRWLTLLAWRVMQRV